MYSIDSLRRSLFVFGLRPTRFCALAGELDSLFGRQTGHARLASLFAALLATPAAHLAHDPGNVFSFHALILRASRKLAPPLFA